MVFVLWPMKAFTRGFRVEGFNYWISAWSQDAGWVVVDLFLFLLFGGVEKEGR